MPIVSSEIVEDRVQVDGRRSVHERHTDDQGRVHEVAYLAEAGENVTTAMNSRVAQINAQLVEAELAANVTQLMGETL